MSSSVLYMSMSLDGFIAGPGDDADHGLGVDGECLHAWLGPLTGGSAGFDPPGASAKVFGEAMATGAVLVGRRTFDLAGHWGGDHHGVPIFIPTTRTPPPPESAWVHYVTEGVESAMRQAKEAAGESNVMVHGASLAQSLLRAGLLDEMEIHLVPVLLGGGRRLFEGLGPERTDLELTRALVAPGVIHLRYRVSQAGLRGHDAASMTHEQLEDAARRIWNKFNAHDLDEAADLPVSPGFQNVNALSGTPPGQEGMRQVAERLYSAFPDMRFEIEEIFVADQRVATLGWMSGTQEGQFGPYPPSGKTFRVRQIHTYGFDEQGRIANHVAVRDDIAMLQQLGHLPVG